MIHWLPTDQRPTKKVARRRSPFVPHSRARVVGRPSRPCADLPTVCARGGVNFGRETWPRDQYVIPGYHFGVDASGLTIRLSGEHREFRWVGAEEARKLLHWQSDGVALWELNERLRNGDLPDPA